jgi:hypothetical protein
VAANKSKNKHRRLHLRLKMKVEKAVKMVLPHRRQLPTTRMKAEKAAKMVVTKPQRNKMRTKAARGAKVRTALLGNATRSRLRESGRAEISFVSA